MPRPRVIRKPIADADTRIMRGLRRRNVYLKELLKEAIEGLEAPDLFYQRDEEDTELFFKRCEAEIKRG